MQKVTLIKTASKRHPEDYVNAETGETLASEVGDGIHINVVEDTQFFSIDSDEYVVFDAGAMEYLNRELAKSELSRVFTLSNMIKGDCSVICQKNNHPYNSTTLPVALELSQDKFYKLVRKLVSKGILAYCVCAPTGFVQKIYMLNPFIARKRKTLSCELQKFFRDITKEEEPKKRKERVFNMGEDGTAKNKV